MPRRMMAGLPPLRACTAGARRGRLWSPGRRDTPHCAPWRTPAAVVCSPAMNERHDATGATGAADATDATDAPGRTALLSGDAAAERLGVSRRTLQRYGERYGLWPVHRDSGRDQTPWYDPRDVERVREVRASRASHDDAPTHDTGHVAAVAPGAAPDLAPVVTRLAVELTRPLGEQIERLARENAELHRRVDAAEAARRAAERERDALRARLDAMLTTPAATEAPTVLMVEADSHPAPLTLWRRLRRRLGGR